MVGPHGAQRTKIGGPVSVYLRAMTVGHSFIAMRVARRKRFAGLWLKLADLMPLKQPKKGRAKTVATYDYLDQAGTLLYQVCRMLPKGFRQRAPAPGGGWTWQTKDVRKVPYRLPELIAADRERPVCLVEGEKDCDGLAKLGFVTSTSPGGACKWRDEYNQFFDGRSVAILPDNDDAGRKHAQQIARALHSVAQRVVVVELPDLPPKGDVSDWLAGGGTAEQLHHLIESAAPWSPSADTPKPFPTGLKIEPISRPINGTVVLRASLDGELLALDDLKVTKAKARDAFADRCHRYRLPKNGPSTTTKALAISASLSMRDYPKSQAWQCSLRNTAKHSPPTQPTSAMRPQPRTRS